MNKFKKALKKISEDKKEARVMHYLSKHKDKDFVKRILNPSLNKGKTIPHSKTGEPMSHMMSSGEVDGKHIVFPNIINSKGKLVMSDDPFGYALKNNEYIEVDSPKEALWLSKNYKTRKFKNYNFD
jgi:ribosomal protein L21E